MKFFLERQEPVFPNGSQKSCHASTLIHLVDGKYLAAWFSGTKEGTADVAIHGAVRNADGVWGKPEQWSRIGELAHWNPVLFQPEENGEILLFFKVGYQCEYWQTWITRSADDGKNWSPAMELVPGAANSRGPVKNKPVLLTDGSLLAPNSLEDNKKWRCVTDRSTDGGKTWKSSLEIDIDRFGENDRGVIQPTLWESAPGKVHMLTRSSSERIYRSDSEDYGQTWCKLYSTGLPNNNSGIDLDRSAVGILLLAYNPVAKNWGERTPLTLAVSSDNGGSWENLCELENAPGEYSYPAVIALPGKRFAGTYTWKRETIMFWEGYLG